MKTPSLFIRVTALILISVAMASAYIATYNQGRYYENIRIEQCYMAKDFSGFAWVDGSKYFTCSADIRKGAVVYTREK